ncbi:hypothetical protein ACJMK2_027053 [Sinanodonta woodiana]|uniref:Uncharacterized protein n=1 Tax=Sinanodonta woodiana TaxID=1069815 RepID=A0ABD3XLY0_SINWO
MRMVLHLLIFFITSNTLSDGRIVRALLGRNVSFSFILKTSDITKFDHGTSRFLTVWPNTKYELVPDKHSKIHVSVNVPAAETIIVTINMLNISRNDGGIYTAKKQFNSKEFNDSVDLQIFGM